MPPMPFSSLGFFLFKMEPKVTVYIPDSHPRVTVSEHLGYVTVG